MKCFKVQGKFIIPCSSKQQWHPALTPHNGIQHGTTSRLSKCVKTTPAYCIQQWHPAMARYWHPSMPSTNGTQQWHPASSNGTHHGIQQWHLTAAQQWRHHSPPIASSNGAQQLHLSTWHLTMAPSQSVS